MSQDWFGDVLEFHEKFVPGQIGCTPAIPVDGELIRIRNRILQEELKEMYQAILDNDVVEFTDGIADSIYALVGTAIACGIDLRPIWDAVHVSNMAKEKAGDKPVKPPGWSPPDVESILRSQGCLRSSD